MRGNQLSITEEFWDLPQAGLTGVPKIRHYSLKLKRFSAPAHDGASEVGGETLGIKKKT